MHSLLAASSPDVPFSILTAIVVTPVIGALVLLLLPSNRPEYFKQVAFLFSGVVAGMTVDQVVAIFGDQRVRAGATA